MSKPPLLVGEAPSRSGDRYWMIPLSGAVAERLLEMAQISRERETNGKVVAAYWTLTEHFDTMNLIERYPGPQGKGAAFPMEQARAALDEQWGEIRTYPVVVLLGARLPMAFDIGAGYPFYEWCWYDRRDDGPSPTVASGDVPVEAQVGIQVVSIPHPSKLNRMYEDPAELERAGAVLREAIVRAQGGDATP